MNPYKLYRVNASNLNLSKILPVPHTLDMMLPALKLNNPDFFIPAMLNYLGQCRSTRNKRSAYKRGFLLLINHHHHLIKHYIRTRFTVHPGKTYLLPGSHLILPASITDNCVHFLLPLITFKSESLIETHRKHKKLLRQGLPVSGAL